MYGEAAVETTADHNAGEDASAQLAERDFQMSAGVLAGINVRWRPRRQNSWRRTTNFRVSSTENTRVRTQGKT